jgi:uncharacterized integral membrane protein
LKYLAWLLKAVIFFVLFAFALNNQGAVTLHFFFGNQWQAPLVLVVLATFVMGLVAGMLVMVPVWLTARKRAAKTVATAPLPDTPSP